MSAKNLPLDDYEGALAAEEAPYMAVVPGRALTDRRLSAFQFRVFALMCGYANRQTRICWPKQETLARLLGTNVQVISKIVAQLMKLGYVEVTKTGFPARNVYRIAFDDPNPKPLAECLPATDLSPQTTQTPDLSPQTSKTCLPRQVRLVSPDKLYNRPIEQTSKSLRPLRDLHDDGGDTRVHARTALAEKIVSAGHLPRQTNRAALAQLIANHPQISDGEWEFQAAAAAEWFTDHERCLTLRHFGSWITRYLREQRQLDEEPEQEIPHGSDASDAPVSGAAPRTRAHPRHQRSAQRTPRQPGTVPHTPETDTWEPDETPWESERERILRYMGQPLGRASDPVGEH